MNLLKMIMELVTENLRLSWVIHKVDHKMQIQLFSMVIWVSTEHVTLEYGITWKALNADHIFLQFMDIYYDGEVVSISAILVLFYAFLYSGV